MVKEQIRSIPILDKGNLDWYCYTDRSFNGEPFVVYTGVQRDTTHQRNRTEIYYDHNRLR